MAFEREQAQIPAGAGLERDAVEERGHVVAHHRRVDIWRVEGEFQRIHRFGQRAVVIGDGNETAVNHRQKAAVGIAGVEVLCLAPEQLKRDRAVIEHQMQRLFHQQGKFRAANGQRPHRGVDLIGLLFHRPRGEADNAGEEAQRQPLLAPLGIVDEGIQRDLRVRPNVEHRPIVQPDRCAGGLERAHGLVGVGAPATFTQGKGQVVIAALDRVRDSRKRPDFRLRR